MILEAMAMILPRLKFATSERVVLGASIVVALSGCSTASSHETKAAVSIGPIAKIDTTAGISMPMDSYFPTPGEKLALERAQDILVANCATRYGIHMSTPRRELAKFNATKDVRFLFLEENQAATYGFQVPPYQVTSEKLRSGGNSPWPPGLSSSDIATVIGGRGASTYAGKDVPVGGCAGEAGRRLSGSGNSNTADQGIVSTAMQEVYSRENNDPTISDMNSRWSACMRTSGYSYRAVRDAWNDPHWGSGAKNGQPPSKAELAAAIAFSKCESRVNYLGVMVAVESAYENQTIERDSQIFRAYKLSLITRIKRANDILSGKNVPG
jgi:hypothetical protein